MLPLSLESAHKHTDISIQVRHTHIRHTHIRHTHIRHTDISIQVRHIRHISHTHKWQKRPIIKAKETYYKGKRDLLYGKRDLLILASGKRDLL